MKHGFLQRMFMLCVGMFLMQALSAQEYKFEVGGMAG